mmetsp:Transcript_19325/g.65692  ORF Transcript_19325/g.65692 Transcript_19325/m.65692 type:complete len:81 (-) Transcript_19325:1101-1343(-)
MVPSMNVGHEMLVQVAIWLSAALSLLFWWFISVRAGAKFRQAIRKAPAPPGLAFDARNTGCMLLIPTGIELVVLRTGLPA